MNIIISVIGAFVAILVSILGAYFANRNSILLQTRKLKESYYISYVTAIHDLCGNNSDPEATKRYVSTRDTLFVIASDKVISNILEYEEKGVGQSNELHDKYLTFLIKSIREDLHVNSKKLPSRLYFKKA